MRRIVSAGILVFLLVGAGTTIFAKSNSARNIFDWYEGEFQQKSKVLRSIAAGELLTSLNDFNQFVTESNKSLDTMFAFLFDEKTSDTQSNIEMQHAKLVNELNETVTGLQQGDFDEYVDKLNIEAELTMEVEKILEELLNE